MSKIYIILPLYNGEKYILEQLMSIYFQEYSHWILYIINDGSQDNSIHIVQKWIQDYALKEKVMVLENKKNIGLNKTIEYGLETVVKLVNYEQDYIAYCDADDIWCRNKLQTQKDYMETNKSIGISYHNLMLINSKGNPTVFSYMKHLDHHNHNVYDNSFDEFCLSQHITATSIMFQAKYISLLLPLPAEHFQDHWTVLVFSLHKLNFAYIPKTLAYYRRHEQSMLGQQKKSITELYERLARVLEILHHKYPQEIVNYYIKYFREKSKWKKQWSIRYLIEFYKYPKIFFRSIKNKFLYYYRRISHA